MPPKKQEKREIKPLFTTIETTKWWVQTDYDKQQIDDFFTNYQLELKDLFTQDLFTTTENLCKSLGVWIHPKFRQKQESELVLLNEEFDYASFKCFMVALHQFQDFNTFKFSNNNMSINVATLLFKYLCENKKITQLYFDWNSSNIITGKFFPLLGNTALETLILRSNNINCQIIIDLCKIMSNNPSCAIKHLELYDNKIQMNGLLALGNLMKTYQKFEYLSLAQNDIKSLNDVKPIFSCIGRQLQTVKEIEQYKAIEKQREDMIAEAAKKKRKVKEDDLPKLPNTIDVGGGKFATMKNIQLKMLNLSMNPFQNNDIQELESQMDVQVDDFQLILVNTQIDEKTKERLRNTYRKKIII